MKAQKASIQQYAAQNGMKVVKIVGDAGVSGTKMKNRHKFVELIEELDAGDALVAYEYTRVSRCTADTTWLLEVIEKKRAYLICIQEGIDTRQMIGGMMANMMGFMGQVAADQIHERVTLGVRFMKLRKQATGRPPYGWMVKDRSVKGSGLIELEGEQEIIKIMKEMRADESNGRPMSYDKIAKELMEAEIISPTGGDVWHPTTVRRIIERGEVYTNGRSTERIEYDEGDDE